MPVNTTSSRTLIVAAHVVEDVVAETPTHSETYTCRNTTVKAMNPPKSNWKPTGLRRPRPRALPAARPGRRQFYSSACRSR